MEIRIRYLLQNEPVPRLLELTPDEYFDPLDDGEILSVRSVRRYVHDFEYTGYPADELSWTLLEVIDGEEFWRARTQLLDGLESFMCHTRESDGSEEIIHHTMLAEGCSHTVRTLKQPGKTWAVVLNCLTVEKEAVFTASSDYCGASTFEQLKAFGEVE